MPTDRRSLPAFLADDATFRTWAQGIHTQITTVGLVQTSDTGQVDLSTAARPAISTFAGYRIYRFADSLQATKPLFIKLEYGTGTVVDRPSLRASIGSSTNGAGTLNTPTGNAGFYTAAAAASKTAGATLESFCSGSTDRLALVTNYDPTTSTFPLVMIIERTRDMDGTPTGHGIFAMAGASTTTSFQVFPFGTTPPAITTSATTNPFGSGWGTISPPAGMQPVDGADVALFPALFAVAGRVHLATHLKYDNANIGALTTFQATHHGALRTFMPLGATPMTYTVAYLWE